MALTFKNSCVTFGPRPFVLVKLPLGIELHDLVDDSVKLLDVDGYFLGNFVSKHTDDAEYSATVLLTDEGLTFVLYDGKEVATVETVFKLKDELFATVISTHESVVVVTSNFVVNLKLNDFTSKLVSVQNRTFIPDLLATGKTQAACMLNSGGYILFPNLLWFENPKSFTKPASIFVGENKVIMMLKSVFNSTKRFFVQDLKTYDVVLNSLRIYSENVVDFDRLIGWQQGTGCQFFVKASNETFFIPSFNANHDIIEPVVFKGHAAACEINRSAKGEMLVTVHDSSNTYLEVEVPLFGDTPAKKIIKDYSFTAPYFYTDVAVFSTNDRILVKVADKYLYVLGETYFQRFDGDFVPFIEKDKFALFNQRTNEILYIPIKANRTV